MPVDIVTAEWLRSDALTASAADADVATAWGALATVSEIASPLALQADADAEAARQLAFFAVPTAIEKVDVPGDRADAVGKLMEVTAFGGGYADGITVFVIAASPVSDARRTTLTVLRRLA